MFKYQVEHYTFFDGWVNCETDGGGNKVYYNTEEEAQNSINESIKDWNDDVDSGANPEGSHYDIDEYRVVKVNETKQREVA
jgi:hypothetical protein